MEQNKKWLDANGFRFIPALDIYQFIYVDGSYTAGWNLDGYEAENAPLEYLENEHAEFMEKAKNKEEF